MALYIDDLKPGAPVEVELFLPRGEGGSAPEVSIVVPALNEQITIAEFIDWCHEGLAKAGVAGEILIIDSSHDDTPRIALEKGARVLRTPKRGLGRAYIDAIPFIRGDFIIMGDCDLTYDFRELKPFVERYREGCDFVMGSRFAGSIEPGAMPKLHRYFGTPLTTWILNFVYHSKFSDIHCGMRGLTKAALQKIDLQSQSWEYASEMVLKASRLDVRIGEVPVLFYKDREGRMSHHKRAGFWSPWHAGWINLKVMLVYTPDSFLLKPGMILFVLGTLLCLSLVPGSYTLGGVGFDLHWMLLGLTLSVLGYGCVQVGVLARFLHGLRRGVEQPLIKLLTYNRGMILAAILAGLGVILAGRLLWSYFAHDLSLVSNTHAGVFGLYLIIIAFQTGALTLMLEMLRRVKR